MWNILKACLIAAIVVVVILIGVMFAAMVIPLLGFAILVYTIYVMISDQPDNDESDFQ